MQLLKDSLGWGLLLWLVGYVLGIALFALAPVAIIGGIIMPIGVTRTTMWSWSRASTRNHLVTTLS
jgi:hypothetical protein